MATHRGRLATQRDARPLRKSSKLLTRPSRRPLQRNCYGTSFERRGFCAIMAEREPKKTAPAKTWKTPEKPPAPGATPAAGGTAPPPPATATGFDAALNTADVVSEPGATGAVTAVTEEPLPSRQKLPVRSVQKAPNKGPWTETEDAYANIIIFLFYAGQMPGLDGGTTLCMTLTRLLRCTITRVTRRLALAELKGEQQFVTSGDPSPEAVVALEGARQAFLAAKMLPAEPSSEPAPAPTSTKKKKAAPPTQPGPVPAGAVQARTAGGRVATVLYRKQRGWFAVELDGNADDEGGAFERKSLRRPMFAPRQDALLNTALADPNPSEPAPKSVAHVASALTGAVATHRVVAHLHAGNRSRRAEGRSKIVTVQEQPKYFFTGATAADCIGNDAGRPCVRLTGDWYVEDGTKVVVAQTNAVLEGPWTDSAGTFSGTLAYHGGGRGEGRWQDATGDRFKLSFEPTGDGVCCVRGHGRAGKLGKYHLSGTSLQEDAVSKLALERTYTDDAPDLPPRPTPTAAQLETSRIKALFGLGSGVPADLRRCIATNPAGILGAALPYVKPSTVPDECVKSRAKLYKCVVRNRCQAGKYNVGSFISEADALHKCCVQIGANAASSLLTREGSREYDGLPLEVKAAAKLAYDGHPMDHIENHGVLGRLARFLIPHRNGVYSFRLAGGVVHYANVAPGQYEAYPTAGEAAAVAHQRNPKVRAENERLERVAQRLRELAELTGRTNELPLTLLEGVATSLPDAVPDAVLDAQPHVLAAADKKGGRGLFKEPLVYLDLAIAWAVADVRKAGMQDFCFAAPGANPEHDACFVGDLVASSYAVRALTDELWTEAVGSTPPGPLRVAYFDRRAFECRLQNLVLTECGFLETDLLKTEVAAALRDRLAFGTMLGDSVASRRSLVLTTKSVLVYGEAESHVWTAFAAFWFGLVTLWNRCTAQELTWREARCLVRGSAVQTLRSYVRASPPAALDQGEAEPTSEVLAAVMGMEAIAALCADGGEAASKLYAERRAGKG